MSLLIVILLPYNLVLFVGYLVLSKSFFFVVSVLLGHLHSLDDSIDLLLGLLIDLFLLEVQVLVDHSGHSLDIWESFLVVLLEEIR